MAVRLPFCLLGLSFLTLVVLMLGQSCLAADDLAELETLFEQPIQVSSDVAPGIPDAAELSVVPPASPREAVSEPVAKAAQDGDDGDAMVIKSVAEPSSMALFAVGLVFLFFLARSRRAIRA